MSDRKPIKVNLSIADSLLVTTGLTYIIENDSYHEIDRELAERLRKEIREEVFKVRGNIERGD
jgi:hypothetical protein